VVWEDLWRHETWMHYMRYMKALYVTHESIICATRKHYVCYMKALCVPCWCWIQAVNCGHRIYLIKKQVAKLCFLGAVVFYAIPLHSMFSSFFITLICCMTKKVCSWGSWERCFKKRGIVKSDLGHILSVGFK